MKKSAKNVMEALRSVNEDLQRRNDELKKTIDQVRRAKDYAETIFESMHNPKLVLDGQYKVRRVNRAFCEFFRIRPDDILGRPVADVGKGHLDVPTVRSLLRTVRQSGSIFQEIDLDIVLPDLGKRALRINARRIHSDANEPLGILMALEDISDRLQVQEARELRNRAAMQREMIANISHELRTPIAAIKASTETLLRGGDLKHANRFIQMIYQHSQRLSQVVEDVLRLSSLESGRRKPMPEKIFLPGFIEEFVRLLDPMAKAKDVKLIFSVEPGLTVWFDKSHLQTILESLAENAIRYNKRNGQVIITGKTSGNEAALTINDTGPGIDARDLPRIFDRFYRGEKTRQIAGGMGLGLPIAKSLIEANSGRISLISSKGRGTAVSLSLPLPKRR